MSKRASLTAAAKQRPSPPTLSLPQVEDWESAGELHIMALDAIDPSPYQPRDSYDEKGLDDLAASIRASGVVQPIVVRPKDDQRYELVAGHRRWLAAQRAEKTTIPAVVRALDDRSAAAISLIENLQREELNPMEEAQGLQRLLTDFGFMQKDLACLLGRSQADITLTLGLLKLLPEVQGLIRQGKLSAGHGRLLYRLPPDQQVHMAHRAVLQGWTVRHLEEAVSEQKAERVPVRKDPNLRRLETILMEHFSLPVKVASRKNGGGSITIQFHSNDECESILARFGLKPDQYQ